MTIHSKTGQYKSSKAKQVQTNQNLFVVFTFVKIQFIEMLTHLKIQIIAYCPALTCSKQDIGPDMSSSTMSSSPQLYCPNTQIHIHTHRHADKHNNSLQKKKVDHLCVVCEFIR